MSLNISPVYYTQSPSISRGNIKFYVMTEHVNRNEQHMFDILLHLHLYKNISR